MRLAKHDVGAGVRSAKDIRFDSVVFGSPGIICSRNTENNNLLTQTRQVIMESEYLKLKNVTSSPCTLNIMEKQDGGCLVMKRSELSYWHDKKSFSFSSRAWRANRSCTHKCRVIASRPEDQDRDTDSAKGIVIPAIAWSRWVRLVMSWVQDEHQDFGF